MPLNEQPTWNEVAAISTGGTVADAFQLAFGLPCKQLLPAGSQFGVADMTVGDIVDPSHPL